MNRFIVLGVVLATTGSAGFAADPPRTIKPVMDWTGIDSMCEKDAFARLQTAKDWQATWNDHRGNEKGLNDPTCPNVDFDSHEVVAIFLKTSRLGVHEVVEDGEGIRVRYRPYGNQIVYIPEPGANNIKVIEGGRGEIDPDKPYLLSFAFVVLPKTAKPIALDADVQNRIGEPPIWKEKATLAATVGK